MRSKGAHDTAFFGKVLALCRRPNPAYHDPPMCRPTALTGTKLHSQGKITEHNSYPKAEAVAASPVNLVHLLLCCGQGIDPPGCHVWQRPALHNHI